MSLSRPSFAVILAMLLMASRPGIAADTATGSGGTKPPISFAPSGSLLSQTKPGQPATPAAAAPGVSFPSMETLVGEMAAAAPAGEQAFYDPVFGIRGRIPPGWKLKDSFRGPDSVLFIFDIPERAPAGATLSYRKFASRQILEANKLAAWLEREALGRSSQRQREGLSQYQARTGTMRTVGDRPAFTWFADYRVTTPSPLTGPKPLFKRERWIESQTQIHTPDGSANLSLRASEKDTAALEAQFESLVQSVTLP